MQDSEKNRDIIKIPIRLWRIPFHYYQSGGGFRFYKYFDDVRALIGMWAMWAMARNSRNFYLYPVHVALTKKWMPNSIEIVFEASEFDRMGEVCSILTKCDCVSYQKFVVKWPPWQHCNSLLQKCVGQSNDRFTFKFNFLPQKQTNYSKQNNSFFYFACVYEDRKKTINISNWSKK